VATETIYGSEVPALRDNADGVAYTMATRFQVSVARSATHSRWRWPITIPHPSTQVQGILYRNSDSAVLGSCTYPLGATLDAWNQQAWAGGAFPLAVGPEYSAAIWTPLRYCATTAYFPTGKTVASYTMPVAAGRFQSGASPVLPTNTSGNATYFADVVTESPAGGTPFTRDYTVRWNVLNNFVKDYALLWRVRNTFQRDFVLRWTVRNAFSRDYAVQWRIMNSFVRDYQIQWQVLNAFQRDYALAWNVRGSWQREYALRWAVRNLFTRDYQLRWRVLTDAPTPSLPQDVTAYMTEFTVASLLPESARAVL
jgi:hypothetical protein